MRSNHRFFTSHDAPYTPIGRPIISIGQYNGIQPKLDTAMPLSDVTNFRSIRERKRSCLDDLTEHKGGQFRRIRTHFDYDPHPQSTDRDPPTSTTKPSEKLVCKMQKDEPPVVSKKKRVALDRPARPPPVYAPRRYEPVEEPVFEPIYESEPVQVCSVVEQQEREDDRKKSLKQSAIITPDELMAPFDYENDESIECDDGDTFAEGAHDECVCWNRTYSEARVVEGADKIPKVVFVQSLTGSFGLESDSELDDVEDERSMDQVRCLDASGQSSFGEKVDDRETRTDRYQFPRVTFVSDMDASASDEDDSLMSVETPECTESLDDREVIHETGPRSSTGRVHLPLIESSLQEEFQITETDHRTVIASNSSREGDSEELDRSLPRSVENSDIRDASFRAAGDDGREWFGHSTTNEGLTRYTRDANAASDDSDYSNVDLAEINSILKRMKTDGVLNSSSDYSDHFESPEL